jgi:hypothetical protein
MKESWRPIPDLSQNHAMVINYGEKKKLLARWTPTERA